MQSTDDITRLWSNCSGLEFLELLADGRIPHSGLPEFLGLKVVSAATGRVECAWRPSSALVNAAGPVHGGYVAMALDDAAGLSCASTTERFWPVLTMELRLDFVRPVHAGHEYRLLGEVIHKGSTRLVADARVLDSGDNLLARASGSFVSNRRYVPAQESS